MLKQWHLKQNNNAGSISYLILFYNSQLFQLVLDFSPGGATKYSSTVRLEVHSSCSAQFPSLTQSCCKYSCLQEYQVYSLVMNSTEQCTQHIEQLAAIQRTLQNSVKSIEI